MDFQESPRELSAECRAIDEIPEYYRSIFATYKKFNIIQSRIFKDIFYSDQSLVVAAPTGSGKTVLFELAVLRLLIAFESCDIKPFKLIYISPMKALCEERLVDWHKKFSQFGINCISATGDSEAFDIQGLSNYHLIITTPEKWDCVTRKWKEHFGFFKRIKLFMIDEVHLLNEDSRGSCLETIICRMKTISTCNLSEESKKNLDYSFRFVAVSASISNIEDIAEWMDKFTKFYKFSDDLRPVPLKKIVLGFSHTGSSPFKFELALNYKLQRLLMEHSHGKPTLIFCSTRKLVEITAKYILQNLTIGLKVEQKERLVEAAAELTDAKVKEMVVHGICYHHAGMLPHTRKVIENLFRRSELPILVTTSTLAVGVNLPAHLVIIKSTKYYTKEGFKDYSETALMQMIGRAGRPQFDTEATALILTTLKDKAKFENMLGGLKPIESNLHKYLIEHLNAEIVLGTITNGIDAMSWLSSTFLYIRARKNPGHYGFNPELSLEQIDRKLLELCQIEINKLIKAKILFVDQDLKFKPSSTGFCMAKYYVAFETMKLFTELTGDEILQQLLALISKCAEFSEMYLRVNDKKCLNLLNKCKYSETIRFPLVGKIKAPDMKINCIIQAVLGCLNIYEHSILTEAFKIMRSADRIVKCLVEYLETNNHCFKALLNAIILNKCFRVQLWENSPYVSKQLAGIGSVMSAQLVNAGKISFKMLSNCDAREIELIINKKPPMGANILEQIKYLPQYDLKLLLEHNVITIKISLNNASDLEKKSTVNLSSNMYLIVGDSLNNILLIYKKYSHSFMLENPEIVKRLECNRAIDNVEAHFISDDWVGIDCTAVLEVRKKRIKKSSLSDSKQNKRKENKVQYVQKFMEMYMHAKNKIKNEETCNINKKIVLLEDKLEADRFQDSVSCSSNLKETGDKTSKIVIHSNINIYNSKETQITGSDQENILISTPSVNNNISINTEASDTKNKNKKNFNISKKFSYTPRKFMNKQNLDPTLVAAVKENLKTECLKPKTKITWSSPLIYSPPNKFSPNFVSFDTKKNITNFKKIQNIQASSTKLKTVLRTTYLQPPEKQYKSQLSLPLSDKDYGNYTVDTSDKFDTTLEMGDMVSSSFMETIGLVNETKVKEVQPSQLETKRELYPRFNDQIDDMNNIEANFEFQKNIRRSENYKLLQKEITLNQNCNKLNRISKNLNVRQPVISHFFMNKNNPKIDKFKQISSPELEYHWQIKENSQSQESIKNYFDKMVNLDLRESSTENLFIKDKETVSIFQQSPETYYEESEFANLSNNFESMIPWFHDSYQVDNIVQPNQDYKQEIFKSQNVYSQPNFTSGLHSNEKKDRRVTAEGKSKSNQTKVNHGFKNHNKSWSIDGLQNCEQQQNFDFSPMRDSVINHNDISDDNTWSSNFLANSTIIQHDSKNYFNNDKAVLPPCVLCRNKCTICTRPNSSPTEACYFQHKSVPVNNLIDKSFVNFIENSTAVQSYGQKKIHLCHFYICNSFVNNDNYGFCKSRYCEMCHLPGKFQTDESIPFVLNQNREETNNYMIPKRNNWMPDQDTQVEDHFNNTTCRSFTSSATKEFVMEKFINSLDEMEQYEDHENCLKK